MFFIDLDGVFVNFGISNTSGRLSEVGFADSVWEIVSR